MSVLDLKIYNHVMNKHKEISNLLLVKKYLTLIFPLITKISSQPAKEILYSEVWKC